MNYDQNRTNILIVDDHPLVCKAVRNELLEDGHFNVVAEAHNGLDAVRLAIKLKPDIVIMDIGLPELNGIEAIRKIKTANPDTIVLVLTVYEDIEHILGILESGADGYLTKNIMIEDIVQSVRLAVAGEAVLSHDVFQKVVKYAIRNNVKPLDSNLTIKLTTRELEILNLLSKGLSNKEIADTLKLKIRTVKSHLVVIFSKLNVMSRTEAVTFGLRSGLIKIGNMDELA